MLNQVILVGRIVKIKEEQTENGRKKAIVTIATPQHFKNANGEYDTNYLDISLFENIATNTTEYCKKGDLVEIKGRLQRIDTEKGIEIIAEKVTFLSSSRKEEDGE